MESNSILGIGSPLTHIFYAYSYNQRFMRLSTSECDKLDTGV
jgi:hypothetical protein